MSEPILPPRQRIRLLYEKGEAIKFISHQDEFRLWERTLRRANLPLLYKQGFNPQPHMQFAAALGVGITGIREPLDITFSPPLPLEELQARISAKLPPGVQIHDMQEVAPKAKALSSLLIGADYTIILYAEPDELAISEVVERIECLLAQSHIPRQRQRKGRKYTYNLRPVVFELYYRGYDREREEHEIFLRVQQRPGATGRPDEVVSALGFEDFARTLRRDQLYFEDVEADAALFAAYPVIEKSDIILDEERPRRRQKQRRRKKKAENSEGRTIAERAADEFV